jgi:hypothetical protein
MNNGFYEFSRGKQEATSSAFPFTGSALITGSLGVTGSLANGLDTIASGIYSHAEGRDTQATSRYSHAEGSRTTASADYSHAEGLLTVTSGEYSHAEGVGTITAARYQHAQGQYNISSLVNSAFIIGNGSDPNNRSNLVFAADNTFQITGSLNVSGSITGSLFGTASFATSASRAVTSSFAISASWAPSQTINTSSLVTTSSFNAFTSSYTTGSFTGSFRGDGSGLTNLPGQSVNTSSLATTGSNTFIGNQIITGSLTATQGITGSLFGTASWATNAITASYVNTLNQNIQISGSLKLDPTQDPDPTGLDLDSTVLFQSSSNTALGYDLYVRQNGNLVKWKWIEGILETGLLYGGVVTYSGSNVFISSGSGIIAEHNATTSSEVSPMIQYVTWNAITQSVSNIATQQVTYLYIDNNGSLQQQSTRFTSQQYHSYIPLGAVGHFDYTQVSAFGGGVQTAYDQGSQTSNFIDAFGPLKVSGYGLTGQTNSLRLSVGSGTSFIHGGFYQNDPEFPSQITTPSQATASLARVQRSGSFIEFDTNAGNLYTVVDPTKYDRDGDGTLANVGSGNWTIQRVFSDPKTGVLYVYYGQARYTSLLNALQFLPTDPFTEGDTFDFTTFVGFLVLKGNTTDITDTADNSIINGGLFRGSGQGSGGGIALSNLEDLTDVSITSPTNGQALIYDSGIWQNGTPISASYALTASSAQGGNGSFSGSFSGSGANLNSIPASAITGLNLSQLATGSVTASVSPTQFTVSSASIAEFTVTGTGVTLGSAITDTHNVTGSLNITGSTTLRGNATITGSLTSTATTLLNTLSGNTAIGLSTDTSTARLQVRGTGITSASNTLLLQNSSLINLLTVRDDGSSTLIGRLNITPTASTTSSLVVTGPTVMSGSSNTVSGSVLTVVGSGSAQPVFTVQGSQGELFSVVDSLSGSLFSVNDISGLPIVEVFSDGTTLIGNYLDPMLITTTRNVLTNSGSFTVYSLPTASYDAAFFDYSVRSGSNARAGQIMAIQSGSSVNYTETTTTDFGTTSGLSLGVFVSGSNMVLTGSASTTAWTIKTIVRSI